MVQNSEDYKVVHFSGKQFYDFIRGYSQALFSSSPADDCVYYIYVEPAKIHLEFCGKELCYILKAEVENDETVSGLMIKGATFDCKVKKGDEETIIIFKSDMMVGESYLVLKK